VLKKPSAPIVAGKNARDKSFILDRNQAQARISGKQSRYSIPAVRYRTHNEAWRATPQRNQRLIVWQNHLSDYCAHHS